MISLRLAHEIGRQIDSIAKSQGKNRSEIIKESIVEYIKNHSLETTPFDLGRDLFGKYSANDQHLAKNRKASSNQIVNRKNEKRLNHRMR